MVSTSAVHLSVIHGCLENASKYVLAVATMSTTVQGTRENEQLTMATAGCAIPMINTMPASHELLAHRTYTRSAENALGEGDSTTCEHVTTMRYAPAAASSTTESAAISLHTMPLHLNEDALTRVNGSAGM